MGRFGGLPSLPDGIWLRTWHAGPQAKQPKIPRAVASLLERDLVEIGPGRYGPCARFTPAGLDALRTMAGTAARSTPSSTPTYGRRSG